MIPISNASIGPAEIALVLETLQHGRVSGGPMVERFERDFAAYMGSEYAIACTSGTTALHLALAAAGIGPGDEVLVPDLTYISTANAVKYVGAQPVLVDIDSRTWGIDVVKAERLINVRTRAILPVHLYGCAADMNAVFTLAQEHDLRVIEDAAEGLGGMYSDGREKLGTCADLGCFSFYGNKVMTTGEGGMVVTDIPHVAARVRSLRGMAQSRTQRYLHTELGFNYRMTDVQAAIGVAQLSRLDSMLSDRWCVVDQYRFKLQGYVEWVEPEAPWLFTCLLADHTQRQLAQDVLSAHGIETRPVFTPLHRQTWLGDTQPASEFEESERLFERGLSLPTWPGMTGDDVQLVVESLKEAL